MRTEVGPPANPFKIVYTPDDVRKGAALIEAETEGMVSGDSARRLAIGVLEAAGLERK